MLISIGAGGPPPLSTARAPGAGGAMVTAASGLAVVVGCATAPVAVADNELSGNTPAAVSEMEGSAAVVSAAL